jgi:hypothetical protein
LRTAWRNLDEEAADGDDDVDVQSDSVRGYDRRALGNKIPPTLSQNSRSPADFASMVTRFASSPTTRAPRSAIAASATDRPPPMFAVQ